MLPPSSAYPRAEMQRRVLTQLERGHTFATLAELGGYPDRQTIYRWAKADPLFAQALARAREWRAGERRGRFIAARAYDEARAEAFLLQVRRGHAVRDLVRRAEWPNREALNAWKRQRPDFVAALEAAVRFARELREKAWAAFDQEVADRIVLRISKGEPLPDLMQDPAMPGKVAINRWRRRRPDFDSALKVAMLSGHRRKMRARRRSTPELTEAIAAHIRKGGSLHSAAQAVRGCPHHVNLYGWMRTRPEFAEEIKWAKRERDDRILERALMIAEAVDPQTAAADREALMGLRRRLGQVRGGAKGRAH